MKINELDLSQVIGDFGAAAVKQAGNRIMGKPEGQMSVKDKMAHDMFIRDFVGRAKADLNAAVKSGLVDVTSTAATQSNPAQTTTTPTTPTAQQDTQQTTPTAQQDTQQTTQQSTQQVKTPTTQQNTQQTKTPTTQQSTQQVKTPTTQQNTQQTATAALSPEEIRKQKQAVAATAANQQAAPFSKIEPAPAVWKNNRTPNAPASRNPVQPMKEDAAAAGQKMSVAQYVKNMFTKYMKKTNIKSPQIQQQLNTLAQEVQSTYGSGAKEALTKLANLAYSVSYADVDGDGVADNAAAPQKTGALDAISAGLKQGLSGTQAGAQAGTQTDAQAGAQTPAAGAQGTTYKQAVDLIKTLDKKGKQRTLAYVQQKLGTATATPEKEPSAMSNMARQLSTMGQKTTSTGGTQVPTGTGVRNTASPTNSNQASKIDAMSKQANAAKSRTRKVKTP